jgi:hypothetical protein
MQLRRLALAALVLPALAVTPATAATKPKPKPKPLPCFQIKDDEGDGQVKPIGLSSPALDVLSADLSSGPTEVTAILRLKSAAVENDHYLDGGAIWNFNVAVDSIKYSFSAIWPTALTPNRQLSGGLTAGSSRSNPEATFHRVGNDFVWTVSRAAFPALKKARQYILITSASSGADSLSADGASAKAGTKYLDKTPTCLRSK